MSKYSDTKLALKNILESITGIGKVFDYRPYYNDYNDFLTAYRDEATNLLKVVFVTPSTATDQGERPTGSSSASGEINATEQIEKWIIEANFAHDEETLSEYAFNEWRELIEDKFRFQQNITTGLSVNWYSRPLQRTYNGLFSMNGNVMVHRCEWTLELVNRIINPN